jgi:hypothetical protein
LINQLEPKGYLMQQVRWGIVGCGLVTEVKSGPALSKIAGSQLVAVMRRDKAKAKDYALRHSVPKWYDNADELINDDSAGFARRIHHQGSQSRQVRICGKTHGA